MAGVHRGSQVLVGDNIAVTCDTSPLLSDAHVGEDAPWLSEISRTPGMVACCRERVQHNDALVGTLHYLCCKLF